MTDGARGADVVVVGGGIIGCACAYELASRGASVILVERSELAAGASGRNHGLLLNPLDPELVPMARASTQAYGRVVPSAPLRVHLDPAPIGFLIVALSGTDSASGRAEAEAAEAGGVGVEHVEGTALRDLEPGLSPDLVEGWLLHDGRRVDPAGLTVALALLGGERGADIRRHLTVRGLHLARDGVRGVVADEGIIEAETVVVAAGPWTASLLRPVGVDVPVIGARGWLIQLAPRTGLLGRLVGGAGWHTLPESEPMAPALAGELARDEGAPFAGGLLQPNPDGTLLAGGSRQAAVTNEPEDPSVPRQIARQAIRLVPALADAPVLSAWWGVRPMTPDGRPVVGRVADGLIVATGHGSQGVILGGGTAALVASMIVREAPPFDPGPFLPGRFSATGENAEPHPVPLDPR